MQTYTPGLLQAVLDTLLELGVPALCVPTFTFSFCNGVPYDVKQSRSKLGAFNEHLRRLPQAERESSSPAVAVHGERAPVVGSRAMNRRELLLDRIRPVLVCPTCRGGLAERGDDLGCATCDIVVRRDGAFRFAGLSEETQNVDWQNAVQAAAKHRMGRLYPLAMAVLGPVYGTLETDAFLGTFGADEMVCDLGAGARAYDDRDVCVDGYGYPSETRLRDPEPTAKRGLLPELGEPAMNDRPPHISVVAPAYRCAECIPELRRRLAAVLECRGADNAVWSAPVMIPRGLRGKPNDNLESTNE